MRIRKRKHTEERIAGCARYLIADAQGLKGNWSGVFANDNNIELEIGCGKGDFISTLAKRNPQTNYIAIEKVREVIVLALEKASAAGLENLRFILGDAAFLNEYFAENELCAVYLNFSDPWHKFKHAKRRLSADKFLEMYKAILKPGAVISQKTDNIGLFEFSIENFTAHGFELRGVTYDLHAQGAEDNIMTEYETNFVSKGIKINRLEAVNPPKEPKIG